MYVDLFMHSYLTWLFYFFPLLPLLHLAVFASLLFCFIPQLALFCGLIFWFVF